MPAQQKEIDGIPYRAECLFQDTFQNMDNWINLNPATEWCVRDGQLRGHWARGGSDIWCAQTFSGDLCVEITGKLLEPDADWIYPNLPEGGKNLNVRFLVKGPNGSDILDTYQDLLKTQTGLNKTGDDQYNGYFFTLCCAQNRMRRSPGYDNVSEYKNSPLTIGKTALIQILKTGNRIQYFLDHRKMHDYTDPAPFQEGRIGIALWCSSVAIDQVEVFQISPF